MQGFNIRRWNAQGPEFWAVSDINTDELQEFVEYSAPLSIRVADLDEWSRCCCIGVGRAPAITAAR
jgi:hypothetical protein